MIGRVTTDYDTKKSATGWSSLELRTCSRCHRRGNSSFLEILFYKKIVFNEKVLVVFN